MKKQMLALVALMLGVSAAAAQPINYRIEANIDNLPAGKVFLVNQEKSYKLSDAVDSIAVTDGKFSFSGMSDSPWIASLLFRADGASRIPTLIMKILFVEDGTVELNGNSRRIEASGTPINDMSKSISEKIVQMRKENAERNKGASKEEVDKNNEMFKKNLVKLSEDVITKNRDNLAGPFLLQQVASLLSANEILDLIAIFTPEIQQLPLIVGTKAEIEKRLKREPGAHFTDFKLPAPDSTEIALSDVVAKNKYVLVDFWASWCGPCINEAPHLKAAYEKYHDKGFEIFGVSYDGKRDSWLGAIEKHGLDWVHVSALKGWGCPTKAMFGITGIPASFLIGPDGIIVGADYRGKALEAKLAELLGDENE